MPVREAAAGGAGVRLGVLAGDLAALRALVRAATCLNRYEPRA